MITNVEKNNAKGTWKPFATSTPLRTKTDGIPQKQFTKGKDAKVLLLKKTIKTINNGQSKQVPEQSGQIAKKIKRNRSRFYFDEPSSSSSEDDDPCLSGNGPPIKINLEGGSNLKNGDSKKKIFVSPKNSSNESNKIVLKNDIKVKNANKRNSSVRDSLNKEITGNDKATENGKPDNEVLSPPPKLKLSFRSKNSNCDYEDSLRESKIISPDKSNSSCKSSKEPKHEVVDLNGCESKRSTTSSGHDLAPTVACGKSSQQHNINVKSTKNVINKSQNSSMSDNEVPHKRKRTEPMINADSGNDVEKKKAKNEKELTPVNESPKNKKKSKLKDKNYGKDSSHQLFSDSMHQELINSLDLTNAELDIPEPNQEYVLSSPWKLTPKKSLHKISTPKGKAVRNINNIYTEETKRSVRQRQPPKEFWMPRDVYDFANKESSVSKGKVENEPTKTDLNQCNVKESLDIKNNSEKGDGVSAFKYPDINGVSNATDFVGKNVEKINAERFKVITKNIETMSKTKKLGSIQKLPNKTSNDAKNSVKDENEDQGEDNKENRTKMDKVNLNSPATNFLDVFKQLNQLSTFEDCVQGVQTSECWSLKNFKCGVLKVNSQCQVSDKTSFKNSYFGGVLIKGSLKMKIGSKDLEINQGDMAFVPPLTEWCAIGTHESESLFYYWCGRFKT